MRSTPPPSDLNALFDLAEKLGYRYSVHKQSVNSYMVHVRTYDFVWLSSDEGATLVEALLNALHEAVKK